MPDTPNMLRGEFYSTHLVSRCPSFSQCPCCKMCQNYCSVALQCKICEDRKNPVNKCECSPTTKLHFNRITELLKTSFSDPDRKPSVTNAEVAFNPEWDAIASGIAGRYGQIAQNVEMADERYFAYGK